jgi:aminodeoxyfutalosine deaminase
MQAQDLIRFIRSLKKAELHVHLEGTADAGLLRRLRRQRGGSVPDDLDRWFRHCDFAEFLQHFRNVLDLLDDPSDYGALAAGYLDRALAQGVGHVEFYLSLGAAARRGVPPRPLLESIRVAADAHPAVSVSLLVDCVRQFGPEEAEATLDLALAHADLDLVTGFGMGGDEASIPAAEFAAVFARARDNGLPAVVHAGEVCGAGEVESVLRHLQPRRIAHGIGAAESPGLMETLAAGGITLDVCLTSNVRTGAVADLKAHPLARLVRAGVPVTLGTDDPGLFATDLTREYRLATDEAGLSPADLEALAAHSLTAAIPRR